MGKITRQEILTGKYHSHRRGAHMVNEIGTSTVAVSCIVWSSISGCMNGDLTVNWIQSVVGRLSFSRRLLVWDTCNAT